MEDLRKKAEKRVKEKKELRENFFGFIFVSGLLLYLNYGIGSGRIHWAIIVMGFMSLALISDAIKLYRPRKTEDELIQEELEQLKKRAIPEQGGTSEIENEDLDLEEFKRAVESRNKQAKKLWNDKDLV